MKKIVIKRIALSNWKSLNIDIKLEAGSNKIKGQNGIGKTSIQSAWNWLWTGYCNPYTQKNHELFDNRKEITHETPIASVKVWLEIDGIEYTIEKTAQAKFTRNRSTNEYIKSSSDVYVTKIDEIEMTATDFNAWIEANLCDVDMLPYCLDGSFFTTLCEEDKKKGRKILERIVGEIKESDFSGDYSILANDFAKGYTIEQIEERVKGQSKPINDRIQKLPSIIEMKEKEIASLKTINYDAIKKEIDARKRDIEDIDNALLGNAKSIEPIIGERNKMFDIINSKTLKLNERKNVYLSKFNSIRSEINAQIDDVSVKNRMIAERNEQKECEFKRKKNDLELYQKECQQLNFYRDRLLKSKDEIKSRIFNEDKCQYCNQDLPYDIVEKSKIAFNKQKQEDLDYVVSLGKQTREQIDNLGQRIKELQSEIEKGVVFDEYISIENLENQLKAHNETYVPFEETEEYDRLSKEIENLKRSLPEIPNNNSDGLTQVKKFIIEEIEQFTRKLAMADVLSKTEKEVDDLRNENRELGCEIALLEKMLYKCKEYTEERAKIISDRVNTKLNDCMIEMFSIQKNGERTPDCIVKGKNGVKFTTLNNAHKILTNIEIQEMFCKCFGIELTTFIDESSVFDDFHLPRFQKQCVYLYASNDEVLVINS